MKGVAVYARDWAHYESQMDVTGPFAVMHGWVIGALVQETDEHLVIAHQWFPAEQQIRHVTVVQKSCVIERREFELVSLTVQPQAGVRVAPPNEHWVPTYAERGKA